MGFVAFIVYLTGMAILGENLQPSLVIGGFGAYGAALFTASLFRGRNLEKLDQWPVASGTVVDFEMKRDIQRTGPRVKKTTSGSLGWVPHIHYRYEVGSASYLSRNFFSNTVGSQAYTKGKLPELNRTYRTGTTIPVHYNPADPADSFIAHRDNQNGMLTGITLAAVCAYLVINNGIG